MNVKESVFMEKIIFYREWLRLDKREFRVLALLADRGSFQGNLMDMCRYFSLNPQTSIRKRLRNSIQTLQEQGFLSCESKGQNYILQAIPKDKEIEMSQEWFKILLRHEYTSESVSWEAVLKVYLWILDNKEPMITNEQIANDLSLSVSTVCSAKNVLEREYNAIDRETITKKIGEDCFRNLGQEITPMAWWSTD